MVLRDQMCQHGVKFVSELDYFTYKATPLLFNLRCHVCLEELNANLQHVSTVGILDDAIAIRHILKRPTRVVYN